VTVEYLDLADFVAIASAVMGLDEVTVIKVANLDLADSALHAPSAGFGEEDFYPDFVDKAGVLIVRLAKNHPLPDGNKRTAWVALRVFVDMNGWRWDPAPSIDEAEAAVLAIAAGEWNEATTADWLGERLRGPDALPGEPKGEPKSADPPGAE
jgi:death on curing protein